MKARDRRGTAEAVAWVRRARQRLHELETGKGFAPTAPRRCGGRIRLSGAEAGHGTTVMCTAPFARVCATQITRPGVCAHDSGAQAVMIRQELPPVQRSRRIGGGIVGRNGEICAFVPN